MKTGVIVALIAGGVILVAAVVALVVVTRDTVDVVATGAGMAVADVANLCASGPSEAGITQFYDTGTTAAFRQRLTLPQFAQFVRSHPAVFSACNQVLDPPNLATNKNIRIVQKQTSGGASLATLNATVAGQTLVIEALPINDDIKTWKVNQLTVQ
jgi:hypothetical protein